MDKDYNSLPASTTASAEGNKTKRHSVTNGTRISQPIPLRRFVSAQHATRRTQLRRQHQGSQHIQNPIFENKRPNGAYIIPSPPLNNGQHIQPTHTKPSAPRHQTYDSQRRTNTPYVLNGHYACESKNNLRALHGHGQNQAIARFPSHTTLGKQKQSPPNDL
jgi:hypothetical protein